MRPRIILAEDHALLLDVFDEVLRPTCDIVATVRNGHDLVQQAQRHKPDVIVVDMAMPLLNGLEAGKQLRQLVSKARLIYLTANEDPDIAAEAIRMGALGYVLKVSPLCELFQAIHDVMQGKRYVTSLIAEQLEESLCQLPKRTLKAGRVTARQYEVLQLLAEGMSMKQAAAVLHVAPRTIAFHKYRVMEEHRLKSNADLVRFAIQLNTT